MTRVKFLPLALLVCLLMTIASPLAIIPLSHQFEAPNVARTSARNSMDYDFRVLNLTVHVLPEIDASTTINYSITFRNFGTDFDYVDIGLPNPYYVLSSFRAYWSLEGAPYVQLTTIEVSEVVSIGVQVYIPTGLRPGNGQEGTLIVWGNQQRMVYQDTVHPGYVGYEFAPTWFDPDYNRATDWLGIFLHFPTGFFNGTLAYYHHQAPTGHYFGATSLVYYWTNPAQILQGISFPYDESYITTYYTTGLEEFWWAYSDLIIIGIVVAVFLTCCTCGIIKGRTAISGGLRLGKRGYLPPAVKVEALGVRRGLTVVEAAVLNEVPLQRVFTMIVFGLLKKDLLRITREGKTKPHFHRNTQQIKKAAGKHGVLHYYERLFLKAITPTHRLGKSQTRTMLRTLIKTTARKLEGYSRTDTQVFYTKMIDKAWNQMDTATTPKAQARALTDYAEWLILTPDYDKRIKAYPTYHVPGWYWWWIWAAHPRPTTLGHTPATLGTLRPTTPITLTNFANATVLGTQTFANNVVTGFQNLANQIATAFRPPPPPPRRSSFSGRSCACACACASCACACAGGGR